MNPKVFFVEDDLSFGSVMRSYLELNNFSVTWVDDGKYAVDRFKASTFDLVILDVMLPNVDGFSIGKTIRQLYPAIPMIFLTAKTLKEDILKGYGLGADDYITKPFDSEVLLCKLKALMKRNEPGINNNDNETFQIGRYVFHPLYRTIELDGVQEKLSPKEAALLRLMCIHKNKLLPRDETLQKLWGDDDYFTARSMDVYVTKLRKYLKDDPDVEIRNIHGSGFILDCK
jgi:DNA-binding response OmpR family regulator